MDNVPLQVQAEADLGCQPDLERLCCEGFVNCELATGITSPLLLQLRRKGGIVKVRIGPTGDCQVSGQCSVEEARHELKKVARRCLTMGYPAKLKFFRVRTVRWSEPYRPDFQVDILTLGKHPSAELQEGNASQSLRVSINCAELIEPGSPDEDFDLSGAAVRAEVAADGRVRFVGGRSLADLQQALEALVPLLEEHRSEAPQTPLPSDYPPASWGPPAGSSGYRPQAGHHSAARRGPRLSRAALALEAPERSR